jgi:hypothetical protein
MKETTKNAIFAIYTFFLNSLENSHCFINGKHYFRKSNGTFSHFYADGAKLMVCGGGIETHAVNTNDEKDIALLACAFYRIFV